MATSVPDLSFENGTDKTTENNNLFIKTNHSKYQYCVLYGSVHG